MCRRRYQQFNTYNYESKPYQRGCCSTRRNYQSNQLGQYINTYGTIPSAESSANNSANTYIVQPESHTSATPGPVQFSHVRRPCSMAGVLILGLSLGAQKIIEKREKKKEKKALTEFANEQREAKLRGDRSSRKREPSERRRSESSEREEDDVPPPSYDEVVRGGARGSV